MLFKFGCFPAISAERNHFQELKPLKYNLLDIIAVSSREIRGLAKEPEDANERADMN